MKFLWVKAAVAWIQKAVAHKGSARGKVPRKRPRVSGARQFYERARLAVRYGALSTRVARIYNAFCRKVRIGKLWFTSSTWGGWWFAALLLAVVFGVGALYLYSIPKDAVTLQHLHKTDTLQHLHKTDTLQHLHKTDTLQHLQFYAVIVIGLGSLYFAGTNFWAKQGSAFFVEYQVATDINIAWFFISSMALEETIGHPANSIMPYVKKIYIRNKKNKHEAIKRILLQLPNGQTFVLKEYGTADALLIKPYEDEVLELDAATTYCKECGLLFRGRDIFYRSDKFARIPNEEAPREGEIIIETVRGQSYIRSNKKPLVSYNKKETLKPLASAFNENKFNNMIFDIDIFSVNGIVMKESFVDDDVFYGELMKEFNAQKFSVSKFYAREGAIEIQITLNTNREASLCYSFQANKKIYAFPVQEKLQKEFKKLYDKNNYTHLIDSDFVNQFNIFCRNWAVKKWGESSNSIVDSFKFAENEFSIPNLNTKIIDDEEP